MGEECEPYDDSGAQASHGLQDFYQSRYGAVLGLAYPYSTSLAEAQDFAQEAVCRAWQRWDQPVDYDEPGHGCGGSR